MLEHFNLQSPDPYCTTSLSLITKAVESNALNLNGGAIKVNKRAIPSCELVNIADNEVPTMKKRIAKKMRAVNLLTAPNPTPAAIFAGINVRYLEHPPNTG